MNLLKYQRIPYSPMGRTWTGCDCWGITRLFYWEELKIELPVAAVPPTDQMKVQDKVLDHLPKFKESDKILKNCIVLMQGGNNWHIGVCIDANKGLVLHSCKKYGAVINPVKDLKRMYTGCVKYLIVKDIEPCQP